MSRDEFIELHINYLSRIAQSMSRKFAKNWAQQVEFEEELLSVALVLLFDKLNAMSPENFVQLDNDPFRKRVFRNIFRDASRKITGKRKKQKGNNQTKSERGRTSLSDPIGEDGELGDLAASGELNREETLVIAEENSNLQKAFDDLIEDEKAVLDLSFGLDGEELSQKEIAERLGISQSRVSQLKKSGLLKMRESRLLTAAKLRDRSPRMIFNPSARKRAAYDEAA